METEYECECGKSVPTTLGSWWDVHKFCGECVLKLGKGLNCSCDYCEEFRERWESGDRTTLHLPKYRKDGYPFK